MSIDVPDTTPIPHTYPVNIIVAGRPCLVVGGGRIAAHKVRAFRMPVLTSPWSRLRSFQNWQSILMCAGSHADMSPVTSRAIDLS